jgi:predicted ATP-dependent endonuclease of OLD family
MPLISKISIRNFKTFREKVSFNLGEGSYFVGINNSGKSTVLYAINAFFDDSVLSDGNIINKTSFLSKKKESNIAEIALTFDLEELATTKFKQELIQGYGDKLTISKYFSVATDTKIVTTSYKINGDILKGNFPDAISKLLNSFKVTYLHPQEGQSLLINAQEKLRQRLLANWGRGSNITQSIKKLQDEWEELRKKSKSYLSGALTENLQKMWPDSSISINLPKSIRDIITISDINFSGYKGAPEIELTSQGTGAQSTILYLTHFLLDSDRTLHRGEYHPLWLLEEPESFLHVDLLANLAKQLNSEKWLNNIQMIISTHSPVLLAGSRIAEEKISWNILGTNLNKQTSQFTDEEIKEIGQIMGDPNFFAYFLAAKNEPLIFIEDEKTKTIDKFIDAGINVSKGLNGIPEISKFIAVFQSAPFVINNKIYFIIDSDKGKGEVSRFYEHGTIDKSKIGFERYKVKDTENVFLIFLPENFSAENLFSEFENHLEECISDIYDTRTWQPKSSLPTKLASVERCIRRKNISSEAEAKDLIKNNDDVKYLFWQKVKRYNYNIDSNYSEALNSLLK